MDTTTPIYNTLKANAPFKPIDPKKIECIESTVDELLKDCPNADEPCLLLGKVQCGKTDTFENIVGLSFDRGIDIAVVFTKGTKPLTEQTKMRMSKDFQFFQETDEICDRPVIKIHDIMDVWKGLKPAVVNGVKTVIVCKKQSVNLDHLITLFNVNSQHLKNKKVLIVDDEADFASRNYLSVKGELVHNNETDSYERKLEFEMAKISRQIDEFRKIPNYCRYLQVTATPYSLFLQPQGELNLYKGKVLSFRPRFTALVPIHDKYIGGQQYFEESKQPESMFSHLFYPVEQKCMDILGHADKRYLNNGISSKNINDLTRAILSYLMATVIRYIQSNKHENKLYHSSALIHVEIDKKNHEWQEKIITKLLEDIKEGVNSLNDRNQTDLRINNVFEWIYNDFQETNQKAKQTKNIKIDLPTRQEIIKGLQKLFEEENVHTQIVNSDGAVENLLNRNTGELQLDHIANIFIGGNILDRGITIKNMLCFFYGRNPSTYQQDAVLQHARMYGARRLEDMIVTRLHTTEKIHKALTKINEIDEMLRQQIINNRNTTNNGVKFIGYDKNIKPCSPQKIKMSNTHTIRSGQIFVPSGFWTKKNYEIQDIVNKIDKLIKSSPCYNVQDEYGFFEIDTKRASDIIRLIKLTYVYDNEHKNINHKSDIDDMLCALQYVTDNSNQKLYCLHRIDRNIKRIKENGDWISTPYNGQSDFVPIQKKISDAPVLMLIRENGKKVMENGENVGWNGTPFYWPVLFTQKKLHSALFAIDAKTTNNEDTILDKDAFLGDINKEDVLDLVFSGPLIQTFGEEGTTYEDGKEAIETREILDTTASRYLQKSADGSWKINDKAKFDLKNDFGIFSLNQHKFPFVARPFKYMLLKSGRDANADTMLMELADPSTWEYEAFCNFNKDGDLINSKGDVVLRTADIFVNRNLNEQAFFNKNVCVWIIIYKIKKILKFRNGKRVDYANTDLELTPREVVANPKTTPLFTEKDNATTYNTTEFEDADIYRPRRRTNFKFSMLGIKTGERLVFTPLNIWVKVAGDDTIEYDGKTYKLSPFAKLFMPDSMRTPSDSYQGPKFFTYKGHALSDLRNEKEKNIK